MQWSHYRNRWYDPKTGRFISEDSTDFASGDINLYGYVGSNPLSFIDPFGFWRCSSDPLGGKPSNTALDVVKGALDVAGLAPGVGILADLTNAGISYTRGNYADLDNFRDFCKPTEIRFLLSTLDNRHSSI